MRTAALDNRKMLVKLAVIALGMFGFGFALVPFYEKICQVAGINNLLQADTVTNTQVDLSRSVIIEFDANTHDMPWRFRPLEASVTVHPGELKTINYEVVNTRDRPVSGQAIPSYGPQFAAQYFRKLECFCFNKQTLAAGKSARCRLLSWSIRRYRWTSARLLCRTRSSRWKDRRARPRAHRHRKVGRVE